MVQEVAGREACITEARAKGQVFLWALRVREATRSREDGSEGQHAQFLGA